MADPQDLNTEEQHKWRNNEANLILVLFTPMRGVVDGPSKMADYAYYLTA